MADIAEVDGTVEAVLATSDDDEARRLEEGLLQQTDNGLHPGDPEEQPSQEPMRGAPRAAGMLDRIIARFESQIGVVEEPAGSNRTPYTEWYGLVGPWCAMFVSWCFAHEGLALPASTSKGFAFTPAGAAWFKKQGRWTSTPQRGHVVFFDFPGDNVNRISHVGIVTAVDGSVIETIEGNTDERGGRTGGKVMRRRRSVGIVGYGVPAYDTAPGSPGAPAWEHPHGPVIRAPHNNCDTVRRWQARMSERGAAIGVDGDYGPQSEGVCRTLQSEKGLEVDGILGPKTWAASWT